MAEERTVYIIGAGFSHHYNNDDYPLMNGLFSNQKSVEFWDSDGQINFKDTINTLNQYFGDLKCADMEEVLAFCELIETGPIQIKVKNELKELASHLSNSIKRYLLSKLLHPYHHENNVYSEWIKSIDNYTTLISFNYDWLIEILLHTITKDKYQHFEHLKNEVSGTRELSDEGEINYNNILLKLHGSLNWFSCTNPLCPNYSKIVVKAEDTFNYVLQEDDIVVDRNAGTTLRQCRNCSSYLEHVIIYPAAEKSYLKYPRICHLWKIARSALWSACKIIVIGYSFRPQDMATSFLFRNSLGNLTYPQEKKWIIIDPKSEPVNETPKERLKFLLPRRLSEIDNCPVYKDLAEFISVTSK